MRGSLPGSSESSSRWACSTAGMQLGPAPGRQQAHTAAPQVSAEEPSQQYKEGKAILERAKVAGDLELVQTCPHTVACESDSES